MSLSDVRAEIPRTIFHVSGGIFLTVSGYLLSSPENLIFLGVVFLLSIIGEAGRKYIPALNRLSGKLLGFVMRPHEFEGASGLIPFTAGVLLAFLLFDRIMAVAALVPLIVGDRAGVLVGKGIGRINLWGKTLEGTMGFIAATLMAHMALSWFFPELLITFGWTLIVGSTIIGALAELLPRPLDDNITIPVAGGAFLYLFA
jgi:dolichol kinase